MTREELEQTNEIASRGACKALSKMVSYPVDCEPGRFDARSSASLLKGVEPNARVALLDSFIVGQIAGRAYLVFPKEALFSLRERLLKKVGGAPPAETDFPEDLRDALEELGNIVVGSYLGIFARSRGLTDVLHRPPYFAWNVWSILLEQIHSAVLQGSHVGAGAEVSFQSVLGVRKMYLIFLFSQEILEGGYSLVKAKLL